MSLDLKDAVLHNTSMQIVGAAKPVGAKRSAELVDIPMQDIQKLKTAQFYTRTNPAVPAVKFSARRDLSDNKNSMSTNSWKRLVAEQTKLYYRHHDGSKRVVITDNDGDIDISPQE